MAEYIEREALVAELQQEVEFETTMYTEEQNKFFNMGLKCAIRDVKSQPAADVVEVRHGYWHLLDNCSNEGVYCSNCRKKVYKTNYANQKIKSNYCPNCGAKMDGKDCEK